LKNKRVELIEIVEEENVKSATVTGIEGYNVKYEEQIKKLDPSKNGVYQPASILMMNYFYLAYNASTTILADHTSWTQMTKTMSFTTFLPLQN
jgi:hypothetical protein